MTFPLRGILNEHDMIRHIIKILSVNVASPVDCKGTIKSGEIKNCIITNKYNPLIPGLLSKLIVTKKVINEGGGNKKASDFTIYVSGNNPSPASFSGSADGITV